MSVDKVKKYFAGYGMESRVLEFDVSSATVELAYKATFGKKSENAHPGAGNRTDRTCGGRRLPICHKSRRGYLPGCFPEKI